MLVMLAAVHFNTIVHPFTLADNRHYVFYVFRLLLWRPWIRYAVVPLYFVSAWLVLGALGGVSALEECGDSGRLGPPHLPRTSFVLLWLATTFMSLVTVPLVEPRYFIVPWLIWRLNVPLEADKAILLATGSGISQRAMKIAVEQRLWIETAWYAFINLVTCYVFLYRGFEWPQEPGKVQRFMW